MSEHDKANGTPAGEPPVEGRSPDGGSAGTAAPDAAPVQPEVAGDEFEFSEPQLGDAKISAEAADSADLDQVEAEAAAVEREAERSTQLGAAEVISSVPAADVDFTVPPPEHHWDADDGTAQAPKATQQAPKATEAPKAAEAAPEGGPRRVGSGVDDGSGWRRPETRWEQPTTQWQQSATPWQPRANAWQSPGQQAQGDAAPPPDTPQPAVQPSQPDQPAGAPRTAQSRPPAPLPEPGRQQGNAGKLLIVLAIVVAGLILVGLLIWLVVGLVQGGTQAAAPASGAASSEAVAPADAGGSGGIIVPQAQPGNWLDGDCLRSFNATQITPTDVVLCSSPHSAQVVASSEYGQAGSFPGDAAVRAKASQLCKDAPITDAARKYSGLQVFQYFPTGNSWSTGDRLVQCIAVDPAGNNITASLVQ
ncbi:septum formation family protein [Arthrobacter sp. STN4]|uniref:septum formation family protein n=1 Tax=Arthrobacter sp. STN4 TaxID=2923276 RepID=UPI00211A67CB|nr:septum formation family protein [Arthrobacter sp. STN4]MCQ9164823.1 septum formation family protein [Arthrobacter sp. STN4]